MLDRARRSRHNKKKIAEIGPVDREIIAKMIFLLPINSGYAVSQIDLFGTLAVLLEGLSDHFFDRKYNSMSIRLCPNIVILYFFLNDQLVC